MMGLIADNKDVRMVFYRAISLHHHAILTIEFHADATLTVDPERAGDIFSADCDPALVPGFVNQLVPEGAAGFDQQPRAVA